MSQPPKWRDYTSCYLTPALALTLALAKPLALVPLTPLAGAGTFDAALPPLFPEAVAPALEPLLAGVEKRGVEDVFTDEAGGFSTNDVSVVLAIRQRSATHYKRMKPAAA